MVPDRGDGARRDHDPLEEVEMDAERVGHRRLDRIGVGNGDHDGARMTFHDPGERRDDAGLHLGEGLAAGEAKAAGVALHDLPLGLAGEPPKLLAGPLADVTVGQIAIDAHGESVSAKIASPGHHAIHGAVSRNCCAVLSIVPQDGAGGCTPSPRNDRTASAMTAIGIEIVAWTSSELTMFGRMCRLIRRRSPAPSARAPRT